MRRLWFILIIISACSVDPEPVGIRSSDIPFLLAGDQSKTYLLIEGLSNDSTYEYLDYVYQQKFIYRADHTFSIMRDDNVADGTWNLKGDTIRIQVFLGYQLNREFLITQIDSQGHSYQWKDTDKNIRVDVYQVIQ